MTQVTATGAWAAGWALAGAGMVAHLVGALAGLWPAYHIGWAWWLATIGFGIMWGVQLGTYLWGGR